MLVAVLALLAAGTPPPAKRPPAQLVVPKKLQEERGGTNEAAVPSALASAQVLAALPPFTPQVGAWAEYAVVEQGKLVERLRLSVLPPALEHGEYWLEIAVASPETLPIATRLLLKGPPERPDSLERAVLWVGGQAPLELPVDETEGSLSDVPPLPKARIEKLAPQPLQTRAGKFTAQRLKVVEPKQTTLLWASAKVPLYGLLKAEQPGRSVELLGYGATGAHSIIPEDPQGNGSDSK